MKRTPLTRKAPLRAQASPSTSVPVLRSRKCKVCKTKYTPRRAFECWCSPECGLVIAEQRRAKAEALKAKEQRKAGREAKQAQKDRTDWASEAQDEVNRYVRYRDWNDGCISCDKPANWGGQWHASHYRSRGAASAIRFHLWNIHKACSECNKFKGGNIHGYTPKIIAKIGRGRVEWLKTQNQVVKHDVAYLKRLKAVFAKKANRQKRRVEMLAI